MYWWWQQFGNDNDIMTFIKLKATVMVFVKVMVVMGGNNGNGDVDGKDA